MGSISEKTYMKRAVEFFTKHPEKIEHAWMYASEARYGRLFGFLSPGGDAIADGKGQFYGCPIMIKLDASKACLDEGLRQRIRADDRIPTNSERLTPEGLAALAEYQLEAHEIRKRMAAGEQSKPKKQNKK